MDEQTARATIRQIFSDILAQGAVEPVSQLEHTLQAAQLARNAECDETVLAALLHGRQGAAHGCAGREVRGPCEP